jgi:hypothetical protein
MSKPIGIVEKFGFNITVFFIVFSSMAGLIVGKHKADFSVEKELPKVIDWNTKQIHSLGVNSAIEKHNSELLIQILNLIEGRKVKNVPREIPLGMLNSDEPIEDDDVPHTFEQVEKDQKEVDRGIRAAAQNNLFQNQTLRNILEKLQEESEKMSFPLHYDKENYEDLAFLCI